MSHRVRALMNGVDLDSLDERIALLDVCEMLP